MLTVLMATYNGAATLPAVLQAYCRLQAPAQGWKLLVVDNGSDDATPAILDAFHDKLPLTCLREGRRGKNAALNTALATALRDAACELLVFSDDDAAPAPDWLRRLAQCAADHLEYAIFGGAIAPDWAAAPPGWVLRLVPLGLTYAVTAPDLPDGPVFPGLVWGANMALRRSVFDAGFRFDDTIGPNGGAYAMGSETQMTRRLAAAGYRSWFCPAARVAHHIRAHQLEAAYILRRAWRFGRGKFLQDRAAAMPAGWRASRWMLRRYATEIVGAVLDGLRRDRDRLFLRRWEIAYLSGYFYEAWRSLVKPTAQPAIASPLLTARRAPVPPYGSATQCDIGLARYGFLKCPKVLITSHSGELGGMELRMGHEARVLLAAGYRSELATRRFPGFDGWARALREERIAVSVFAPPLFFEQWRWRRLNLWRARLLASRRLRRYRPDLVHVAFCWTTYGASVLWLVGHCRLPAVISVHNAFPPAEISAWHRPLLAEAFRCVRGVYAVSSSAMAHFLALFESYLDPATKLMVIPNGVDTARFAPSPHSRAGARRRLGLPADALVLGSVARLSVQKRPQALLALFAALLPRFPDLYLVLVGQGPLEGDLRAQAAAAGVGGRVVFAGFCREVETVMPAFDLHLLLSRGEGFGIATIEAMACGVPALGTDVPGTADILRDSRGGMLLPLADPGHDAAQGAVALVAALLADPARRGEMARHARLEAEQRYSSERLRLNLLEFYRGLV